jgi:hypothetical protein
LAEQLEVDSVMVVQTGGGGATNPPSADATPALPAQLPTVSGTQVNPLPQSESTWHGSSYWGTQELVVIDVHGGGVITGHFVFGGQDGAAVGGQLSIDWVKQTIPVAQSLLVVHGSGAHAVIICGSHGGGAGQLAPGGHPGLVHALTPTIWQANPFGQSLLWEHIAARAPLDPSHPAPASRRASERRKNERDIMKAFPLGRVGIGEGTESVPLHASGQR